MSLNISFKDKTILITGGGQGIGRQLVQRFHDGGAHVITIDKNPFLIKTLHQELPNVQTKVLDLTNWEETQKLIPALGPIDYLVNCAGIITTENFLDVSKESAAAQVNINFLALFNVSQCFAKGLIKRGKEGVILNVSSCAAQRVGATCSVYCATKAAVENLTKTMAIELAPHNIRVVTILPGGVSTPLLTAIPAQMEACMQRHVIKELVDTDDIANLVIFLLSPSARMITGSVPIDAGYTFS